MHFNPYEHTRLNDNRLRAFTSGRRLGRLRWHLQQGWILACDLSNSSPTWQHFSRLEDLFDALAATACECANVEPDKWFRTIVSQKERVISDAFPDGCYEQHLWWSRYESSSRDVFCDADRREQFSRENVWPHWQRIRRLVHKMFDEEQRSVLRIGELVEEGLCRPDVVRFSKRCGSWEELLCNLGLEDEEITVIGQETPKVAGLAEGADLLATESHNPGDLAPQREWTSHLSVACQSIGVDIDIDAVKSLRLAVREQRLSRDLLRSQVGELAEHICGAIESPTANVAMPPRSGYLGIAVDRDKGHITRDNSTPTVILSKKEMPVFLLLLRHKGTNVPIRSLLNLWGDNLKAKGTLQTTISRMNRKLLELGLWIQNQRGVGYSLNGSNTTSGELRQANLTKL